MYKTIAVINVASKSIMTGIQQDGVIAKTSLNVLNVHETKGQYKCVFPCSSSSMNWYHQLVHMFGWGETMCAINH